MRLTDNTPAKIALKCALENYVKPIPPWLNQEEDPKPLGFRQ